MRRAGACLVALGPHWIGRIRSPGTMPEQGLGVIREL